MKLKQYIIRGLRYIFTGVPVNNVTVNTYTVSPNETMKDKCVLVTGGGSGIGYYIAKKCINEGAKVVITGRNIEKLEKASKELGDSCLYIQHDIRDVNEVQNLFQKAENLFGKRINCLVSNAGVSFHEGDFRNVTSEGWDEQLDTNLKGNYFVVKGFVEYLDTKDDKTSSIVVITSERSKRADDIPYGLTKTATNSFVKGIAKKVIKDGIRINGVGPGVTESNMTGYSRNANMYAEYQPTKRIFLPEEMAEVVVFLLSDVSNCISGEIIICDQGRYINTW